jgi:hypothetical protein
MRQRSELLAQVQQTTSPYNLPEIGQNLAYQANRDGVAEHGAEPAGHKRLAVDCALLTDDDPLLSALEWSLVKRATPHEANTCYRRRAVPGVGTIRARVRRDDIHDSRRLPRVQDVAAYGRLVTCARPSAGKREGNSGPPIGTADLTWACSDAAVLCRRHHPAGQKDLARFENTHGHGKAWTILAHQLARAVYDRRTRASVCALDTFLGGSGEPRG